MKEYLKLKNLHSLFERNFFLLNSLVDDFNENKFKEMLGIDTINEPIQPIQLLSPRVLGTTLHQKMWQ